MRAERTTRAMYLSGHLLLELCCRWLCGHWCSCSFIFLLELLLAAVSALTTTRFSLRLMFGFVSSLSFVLFSVSLLAVACTTDARWVLCAQVYATAFALWQLLNVPQSLGACLAGVWALSILAMRGDRSQVGPQPPSVPISPLPLTRPPPSR